MGEQKKIFFPNLDGIRFLCFLSVFLFHSRLVHNEAGADSTFSQAFTRIFANGNLGVNFFFVLSGFLITYLLINERSVQGKINIPKFWLRRILRIWPLYFLCVALGFYVVPFLINKLGGIPYTETASLGAYLTFTSNFDYIKNGFPGSSILGVLWSIAVEEQFYLVWPVIMSLIPVKRYPILFGVIIAGSVIFRYFNQDFISQEVHTLSCIGDMAVGALGAYLCTQNTWRQRFEQFSRPVIVLIYVAALSFYFFRTQIFGEEGILQILDRTIIAIAFLLIIIEQNFSRKSLFKFSANRPASNLGVITYGLYCYHPLTISMVAIAFSKAGMNSGATWLFIFQLLIALIVTFIVAKLSYKWFESVFLKIKLRYSYIIKGTEK